MCFDALASDAPFLRPEADAPAKSFFLSDGVEGDRTPDLLDANQAQFPAWLWRASLPRTTTSVSRSALFRGQNMAKTLTM